MATSNGTRSRAKSQALPAEPDSESVPHIEGGAFELTPVDVPDEREVLFTKSGVEYTIPKQFDAAWAVEYMQIMTKFNEDLAVSVLLEHALGAAGHTALSTMKGLDPKVFNRIINILVDRMFDAIAAGKAKLPKPSGNAGG